MKVDDLLDSAGSDSLKLYTWGQGVVNLINTFLPEGRRMTAEITGVDAKKLVRGLAASVLVELLVARIDPATGLKIEADEKPPVEKPAAKTRVAPAKRPYSMVALGAGILMTLMGLMVAFAISFSAVKDGEKPDKSMVHVLEIVVDLLSGVVKDEMKEPAPADKAAPAAEDESPPTSAVEEVPEESPA